MRSMEQKIELNKILSLSLIKWLIINKILNFKVGLFFIFR